MEQGFYSFCTVLWYPYSGPGTANVVQVNEGTSGYFANSENYLPNNLYTPRPVQAVTGS